MASWQQDYQAKKVDPASALDKIMSGDHLIIGPCCGEPQTLIETLVSLSGRWENLTLFTIGLGSPCLYAKPELAKSIKVNTIFPNKKMWPSLASGQVKYLPHYLSQVPTALRSGAIRADVTILQVSVPDRYGYCSMGISVDYLPAAIERSKLVIAEVNEKMPFTLGSGIIHVSKFDYIIESSRSLLCIAEPSSDEGNLLSAVAANVSTLVDDGATIQIGIGALPEAIVHALIDKKDLGVHSGMISDGIAHLVDLGVVNNRRKAINQGKVVTTYIIGTEALYKWANYNPVVEMYPSDYTHNAVVLAKLEKFTAINSAVAVDLTGQVNAEMIDGRQLSGAGGQVDFMSAASRSASGRAIIAMLSTTMGGKKSKIIPLLGDGHTVTTQRSNVDYVVTEHGIAALRGKSVNQRAKEMIKIADPRFRDELEVFRQRYYP